MFPTLAQFGPVAISSLGFFLFLGFIISLFTVWQKGREENFNPELLVDGFFSAFLVGFLGARLGFFLISSEKSLNRFFNFFQFPGFFISGGLLGCVLFLFYFAKKQKWAPFKLLDVYVFGIIIWLLFLRIGNLLDGSFYGKESQLPWAIKISGLDYRVHPLALYEIIFLGAVYVLISRLERQYRLFEWYKNKRGEAAPGFLFLSFFFLYGVFSFLLEFLNNTGLYWKGLSWPQWFYLIFIVASLIFFYRLTGRGLSDIFSQIFEIFNERLLKKKSQELKVYLPTEPKRKPLIKLKKNNFHIKAGMDVKTNESKYPISQKNSKAN